MRTVALLRAQTSTPAEVVACVNIERSTAAARRNSPCQEWTLAIWLVLGGLLTSLRRPQHADHADTDLHRRRSRPPASLISATRSRPRPDWDGEPRFRAVDRRDVRQGWLYRRQIVGRRALRHASRRAGALREGRVDGRSDPGGSTYRPGSMHRRDRRAAKDPDYRVARRISRVRSGSTAAVPEGSVVLDGDRLGSILAGPGRYMNERNGVKHFPGLSADALVSRERTPRCRHRHRYAEHRLRAVNDVRSAQGEHGAECLSRRAPRT